MGRLIDIDVLFDYFGNDAIDETTRSNIEYFVSEKGTVEAIPKAEYENRLKADMVAMLDKIRAEIIQVVAEETKEDPKWASGLKYSIKIIDKLAAGSEPQESEDK